MVAAAAPDEVDDADGRRHGQLSLDSLEYTSLCSKMVAADEQQ